MAVFTRLMRLVRADMHGVMDQLEDKGLLMRQHLREMEASVEAKQARLAELESARQQSGTLRERTLAELSDLEADLDLALAKGKDDLGRMLIRKVLPLRARAESLASDLEDMVAETGKLTSLLEEQQAELEAMRGQVRQALRELEAKRAQGERDQARQDLIDPGAPDMEAMVELELLKRKERLENDSQSQGRAS